ncbi:MAG TPA: hypothetical protein VLZ72_06895, partial [Flavobacterium sp.]|nr:hypothetical protein [Flavobacterium sp.]
LDVFFSAKEMNSIVKSMIMSNFNLKKRKELKKLKNCFRFQVCLESSRYTKSTKLIFVKVFNLLFDKIIIDDD